MGSRARAGLSEKPSARVHEPPYNSDPVANSVRTQRVRRVGRRVVRGGTGDGTSRVGAAAARENLRQTREGELTRPRRPSELADSRFRVNSGRNGSGFLSGVNITLSMFLTTALLLLSIEEMAVSFVSSGRVNASCRSRKVNC